MALTKNDEEPTSFTSVGSYADPLSRGKTPRIDTPIPPKRVKISFPLVGSELDLV
jgi:hypothetical protein